ncbi:MAG: deoxyribodipyrimidine photo-lyase [Alphaproteobacteria bacterium]|nr:MAG: deoxyribodipyrimidine photo-lyase [Alphaproteobacteria bacterium]
MIEPTIVWFRTDLRLADNPALSAAAEAGPVVGLYVLDEGEGQRPLGGAQRWWLHGSLAQLSHNLTRRGVPLVLARGAALPVLRRVIAASGARRLVWNRLYEPGPMQRDAEIKQSLRAEGLQVHSFNGSLLFEAGHHRTGAGDLYRVFTPFWRAIMAGEPPPKPLPVPTLTGAALTLDSEVLADWALRPTAPNWAKGFEALWQPGEATAASRLQQFIAAGLSHYADQRDRPDIDGTSRLSPWLHWGELSPRQLWWTIRHAMDANPALIRGGEAFLREVGWREFSMNLLAATPTLPARALRPEFERFPWREDPAALSAWQRGRTGYPIVDAGMRQLWQTGWMHNRVRMIVASFLVKHLLLDWRHGEAWFWDTLVDADLANNVASWQWVAGCGADAAPYFRIFNPVLQGPKFDPEGAYVRRFVPELAHLPTKDLHAPWAAPAATLERARVKLGHTYPRPLVDHADARARALAAFATLKGAA